MNDNRDLPAFPTPPHALEGITKREYFVAHAPDVPDWFKGSLKEPKKPQYYINRFGKYSDHPDKDFFMKYWNDELDDFDKNVIHEVPDSLAADIQEAEKEWDKYYEEQRAWESVKDMARLKEWRYFYADQMLKEE